MSDSFAASGRDLPAESSASWAAARVPAPGPSATSGGDGAILLQLLTELKQLNASVKQQNDTLTKQGDTLTKQGDSLKQLTETLVSWNMGPVDAPETVQGYGRVLFDAAAQAESADSADFLVLPAGKEFLGLPGLGAQLFVRPVYTQVFKKLLQLFNSGTRCVIWSGSPGTGKSCGGILMMHWLVNLPPEHPLRPSLIAYDRDQDCKPRLLFRPSERVKEGGLDDFRKELASEGAWHFIDGQGGRRASMKSTGDCRRTVIVVSPQLDFYSKVLQQPGTTRLFTPPWSEQEIEVCRKHIFPNVTPEAARERIARWGGSPRYALQLANEDASSQDAFVSAISSSNLELLMRAIGHLDAGSEVSHKILSCKVLCNEDDSFDLTKCLMDFASDSAAKLVTDNLLAQDQGAMARFLMTKRLQGQESLRGVLFEQLVHSLLVKEGQFDLRWLTESRPPSLAASGIEWGDLFIRLPSCDTMWFSGLPELADVGDVYARPSDSNFAAADSILLLRGGSVLFQCTVGKDHPQSMGGMMTLINALQEQERPPQALIFVVTEKEFNEFKAQSFKDTKRRVVPQSVLDTRLAMLPQAVMQINLQKVFGDRDLQPTD